MKERKIYQGIAVDPLDVARLETKDAAKNDFVYIGNEFCQNIFPTLEDFEILNKKGARKVVLVTSFMTGERLFEIKKRLRGILAKYEQTEIVINDFGLLLHLCKRYPHIKKGIGRPLSVEFIRMDYRYVKDFFKKHGIDRLETDEIELAHNIPVDAGFKITFHSPFKLVAVTRLCPHLGKIAAKCERECYQKKLRLKVPGSDTVLLCKNNAYFFQKARNFFLPPGVDRLIKHCSPLPL